MIWRKKKKERIIGFFSLSKSKGQEQWEEENVVENGPEKGIYFWELIKNKKWSKGNMIAASHMYCLWFPILIIVSFNVNWLWHGCTLILVSEQSNGERKEAAHKYYWHSVYVTRLLDIGRITGNEKILTKLLSWPTGPVQINSLTHTTTGTGGFPDVQCTRLVWNRHYHNHILRSHNYSDSPSLKKQTEF